MVGHDESAACDEPPSRRYTSSPYLAAGRIVALRLDTTGRIAKWDPQDLAENIGRDHVLGNDKQELPTYLEQWRQRTSSGELLNGEARVYRGRQGDCPPANRRTNVACIRRWVGDRTHTG